MKKRNEERANSTRAFLWFLLVCSIAAGAIAAQASATNENTRLENERFHAEMERIFGPRRPALTLEPGCRVLDADPCEDCIYTTDPNESWTIPPYSLGIITGAFTTTNASGGTPQFSTAIHTMQEDGGFELSDDVAQQSTFVPLEECDQVCVITWPFGGGQDAVIVRRCERP